MLYFNGPGFVGLDHRCRPAHHSSSRAVPHTKWRRIGRDVSSVAVFLKQKEEDWQQMLAQSQSSSPKKGKKSASTI